MYREEDQSLVKKYEEYAYVLDTLPLGRPGSQRVGYRTEGLIQMIGETFFTLLEAVPRRGANFGIGDRVYVGKKGRVEIEHITGRVAYDDLSSTAKGELLRIIETIVVEQGARFIRFFNESQSVTPRMHSLELIPGIGKKLMWQILNQREMKKFTDFEDLKQRGGISDPVKMLGRRVLEELSQEEKYRLFTRPE